MKHLSVFHRWTSTARSSIAALNSYLEQQMSYVQRAATAIASLPAGSSEEDVRQLLDEYFQRSDFAQMWAVSLDSAFDGQSGYSAVYNSPSTRTTGSMCMCRCG